MTVHEVEVGTVHKAVCDGPGCGLSGLFEGDAFGGIPEGWYRVALGGHYVIFDALPCLVTWFRHLSVERIVGGGTESTPFLNVIDPPLRPR